MNEFPLSNFPYTRTYRFSMEDIAKLSDLSQRLRKSQAEIVREALCEYYENHKDEEFSLQPAAQEA
jgi:predicted DNA-binding protein